MLTGRKIEPLNYVSPYFNSQVFAAVYDFHARCHIGGSSGSLHRSSRQSTCSPSQAKVEYLDRPGLDYTTEGIVAPRIKVVNSVGVPLTGQAASDIRHCPSRLPGPPSREPRDPVDPSAGSHAERSATQSGRRSRLGSFDWPAPAPNADSCPRGASICSGPGRPGSGTYAHAGPAAMRPCDPTWFGRSRVPAAG